MYVRPNVNVNYKYNNNAYMLCWLKISSCRFSVYIWDKFQEEEVAWFYSKDRMWLWEESWGTKPLKKRDFCTKIFFFFLLTGSLCRNNIYLWLDGIKIQIFTFFFFFTFYREWRIQWSWKYLSFSKIGRQMLLELKNKKTCKI